MNQSSFAKNKRLLARRNSTMADINSSSNDGEAASSVPPAPDSDPSEFVPALPPIPAAAAAEREDTEQEDNYPTGDTNPGGCRYNDDDDNDEDYVDDGSKFDGEEGSVLDSSSEEDGSGSERSSDGSNIIIEDDDNEKEEAENERMKLIAERDREDNILLLEHLELERDRLDSSQSEVFGEGAITHDLLAEYRSTHILDRNSNLVHKRTLIKRVNQGRSLSLSTDRVHRVRGDTKTSNRGSTTSSASSQTVVGRATEFATSSGQWRFTLDSESDPNSGTSLHKSGDFCGVIVQSKLDGGGTKKKYMVIGKFQRFGDATKRVQLDLFTQCGGDFRATVLVLDVLPYTNMAGQECLEVSDQITGTLYNVDSSCLIALSPSIEEITILGEDELPSSHDSMKLDDLKAGFDILLLRGKHHDNKDSNIKPINLGSRVHFIADAASSSVSRELLVCSICDPPKTISRP